MSRWGEMFHALSQSVDTADTADTTPLEPAALPPCVSRVSSVTAPERENRADTAPAAEQSEVARFDDLDERAALIEEGAAVPRTWAEGFAALCAMPAPTGFSTARWQRIVDATGKFLDTWADMAIACGWTDLDVFGCDPDRPDARFDAMGLALLLDRCDVVAVDKAGADLVTGTGARQRYRRRPLPATTVSLWQLLR